MINILIYKVLNTLVDDVSRLIYRLYHILTIGVLKDRLRLAYANHDHVNNFQNMCLSDDYHRQFTYDTRIIYPNICGAPCCKKCYICGHTISTYELIKYVYFIVNNGIDYIIGACTYHPECFIKEFGHIDNFHINLSPIP
jgi:hypothetical protein